MAGSWVAERFPVFAEALRLYVEDHRTIEGQPLHLALAYQPAGRDPRDIYLIEVVGLGELRPNSERDLFEVGFVSPDGFSLEPQGQLHLVLAVPGELDVALRERWPRAEELAAAVRDGDCQVLHVDAVGREELARLRAGTWATDKISLSRTTLCSSP